MGYNRLITKMKKVLLTVVLFCCSQLLFAEYAIIDRIVYNLDFVSLTATVLNFHTSTINPGDVTIPETIEYKNDIYKVTRLSYYAFDYDAISNYQMTSMFFGSDIASYGLSNSYKREEEEMKYHYNYKEARANIVHLNLPNTLEEIKGGAFDGMIRLKTLIIPASVTTFTDVNIGNLLNGNKLFYDNSFPRLETITILGTPTCETGYNMDGTKRNITIALQNENGEYTYLSEMAKIVAEVDLYTNKSKLCPNLKSFSMPEVSKKINELIELQQYCKNCNSELRKIVENYNEQLQNDPFYDGSQIQLTQIDFYADYTKITIDNELKGKKDQLSQQYNDLVNWLMKSKLRKNTPAKYITAYQNLHPEVRPLVDSIYKEYRCYLRAEQHQCVLQAIDGKVINMPSCRDSQYQKYSNLFANINEFNERYDAASRDDDFVSEISKRQEAKDKLLRYEVYIQQKASNTKLQGMSDWSKEECRIIMSYLKEFYNTYYYTDAVDILFKENLKIKQEYEKNGEFFSDREEFFQAYISSEYKSILKNKKKLK